MGCPWIRFSLLGITLSAWNKVMKTLPPSLQPNTQTILLGDKGVCMYVCVFTYLKVQISSQKWSTGPVWIHTQPESGVAKDTPHWTSSCWKCLSPVWALILGLLTSKEEIFNFASWSTRWQSWRLDVRGQKNGWSDFRVKVFHHPLPAPHLYTVNQTGVLHLIRTKK